MAGIKVELRAPIHIQIPCSNSILFNIQKGPWRGPFSSVSFISKLSFAAAIAVANVATSAGAGPF
jgi:hypothetical protein